MNTRSQQVIVGLSGGVDSSVSAYLLKEQGYTVRAVYMQNWQADQDDPHCQAEQDLTDARTVCDKLNIPFNTVNFSEQYWDDVFQHCLDEFSAGRTPNPDIWCNQYIKFNAFLDYALAEGADFLATGHYARCVKTPTGYQLLTGRDSNKDQSYFLYTLTQQALAHVLFPLGELTKPEVRAIAKSIGLPTHSKKDSTGICFIGERKFKTFLQEYLLTKPGPIETLTGDVLGRHDGLMYYTIGQRKGLQIGGRRESEDAPWYVAKKDVSRNALIVVQGHAHPTLYAHRLTCNALHWIHTLPPRRCQAKIRYRHPQQACTLGSLDHYTPSPVDHAESSIDHYTLHSLEHRTPHSLDHAKASISSTQIASVTASIPISSSLTTLPTVDQNTETGLVVFDEPQWAITPGQSIVFYDGNLCLGGGIITDVG